ncbi:hypothetical protein KBC75_05535 [Candidatus Shapirobacteria bacterium]|nr:hypothetical protein [Candidatus Shapirobacteria bacterium]
MPATIDNIELHVKAYRSALKSNMEVTVNSLTPPHLKMESILHPLGKDTAKIDTSALVYSLLRLPYEIDQTELVIMGQNPEVFSEAGYPSVTSWPRLTTRARRRPIHLDSATHTLAYFIGSVSDIDDIVNILIAYQWEWNKLHQLLQLKYPDITAFTTALKKTTLASDLKISPSDFSNLTKSFGKNLANRLENIYRCPQNLRLRLLAGSWIDYTKTVQHWYKNLAKTTGNHGVHLSQSNIYFVSSNSHSLLNTITGFPLSLKKELLSLLKKDSSPLLDTWDKIQKKEIFISESDFLYYVFRNYQSLPEIKAKFSAIQQKLGIISAPSAHYLDVNAQIFPISSLARQTASAVGADPRLKISKKSKLDKSESFIVNIDYPLGFAAYLVLNELFENVKNVNGVYILGKAAVLNSEVGDIEIPKLVFDEHTQNTYMFKNCFNSFFPYTNNRGSTLTNQKAVSLLGTFLQNDALIKKYLENNITVVEMESGPYLSSITEITYDQQYPQGTIVDLNSAPLDLGIINYTSDTPYSQATNLGAGSLDLNGLEPVYLGTLAILQRIINLEEQK